MTYNLRLRFTILHFEQRFRMDGETFMKITPSTIIPTIKPKVRIIP